MKIFTAFSAALFLLFFSLPGQGQEEADLTTLTGFPVMEGFVENSAERIIFDKPGGRIIQTTLHGQASLENAVRFYRDTLYQLGWRLKREIDESGGARLHFEREDEALHLSFTGNGGLVISLELAPLPG